MICSGSPFFIHLIKNEENPIIATVKLIPNIAMFEYPNEEISYI
jgi:hypothetical protein